MENFLKKCKIIHKGNWTLIDPPIQVARASLYSFCDYAQTFLPNNANLVIVNESGSLTVDQIIQIVEYGKRKKAKIIFSSEGGCHIDQNLLEKNNLLDEYVWAVEMRLGTITNTNEIFVPQPWFRMQQGWLHYKKKMIWNAQPKKYLSCMRCKSNYNPKMLLYKELEELGILDNFMWTSTFKEPSLKSVTPKFFPSENNFQGVNAELPSLEQTQSYTHTVIETAHDNIASEKIWQAFAFSQPIFWWSINDHFKVVENFGFEIYFDGIDASYLDERNYEKRAKLLALEIKKLVDYPDLAQKIYTDNKLLLQHNHNLFFDVKSCQDAGLNAIQSKLDI